MYTTSLCNMSKLKLSGMLTLIGLATLVTSSNLDDAIIESLLQTKEGDSELLCETKALLGLIPLPKAALGGLLGGMSKSKLQQKEALKEQIAKVLKKMSTMEKNQENSFGHDKDTLTNAGKAMTNVIREKDRAVTKLKQVLKKQKRSTQKHKDLVQTLTTQKKIVEKELQKKVKGLENDLSKVQRVASKVKQTNSKLVIEKARVEHGNAILKKKVAELSEILRTTAEKSSGDFQKIDDSRFELQTKMSEALQNIQKMITESRKNLTGTIAASRVQLQKTVGESCLEDVEKWYTSEMKKHETETLKKKFMKTN